MPADHADTLQKPEPEGLEWSALDNGGANFKTRRLRIGKNGAARIVPSLGLWSFAGVWTFLGTIVMLAALTEDAGDGPAPPGWLKISMAAFGGVFLAAGVGILCLAKRAPAFDVQSQCCRGLKPGLKSWGETPQDVPFSQIAGVQVLPDLPRSSGRWSRNHYQLNLVGKDLARWHIMSRGNLNSIEADAQALAQLLRVPLWKRV